MRTSFLLLMVILSGRISAQVPMDSELYLELQKHDSIFFEKSFNKCDLEFLEKAVHEDLVFYHDKSGIQNKQIFIENIKKYICAAEPKKPIRKPKPKSLEVYPLYENEKLYGVVQNGIHEFYITESGQKDIKTGEAKFTHVYLLVNEKWILKQVLSFDHK
jgi:hypothetical protein